MIGISLLIMKVRCMLVKNTNMGEGHGLCEFPEDYQYFKCTILWTEYKWLGFPYSLWRL